MRWESPSISCYVPLSSFEGKFVGFFVSVKSYCVTKRQDRLTLYFSMEKIAFLWTAIVLCVPRVTITQAERSAATHSAIARREGGVVGQVMANDCLARI